MRQIIEKTHVHQVQLHLNVVDMKAASDRLDGRTDYKIYKSERTYLPLNLSQMSQDTEDSCLPNTSLDKHTNKTSKDTG